MLQKVKILLLLFFSVTVMSCGTKDTSTADSENNPVPAMPDQASVDTQSLQAPGSGTMTAAPAGQATGNQGPLNPAHGEPGHRCDIAVGAPLNSPPGQSPSAPAMPPTMNPQVMEASPGGTMNMSASDNPVQVTPTPAPGASAPGTTAPGMNPPHGEPGHDCSIAVGAPLKK